MTSPARRHWLKATAAAQAAEAEQHAPQTGDAYELMKATLIEDRRRLHDVHSVERKVELKRELLPQYQEYVEGVLEAGQGAQDDVLATLMVWHLDVGNLQQAVEIGEYVLTHELKAPDQFQRSPAAILVEDSAEAVLRKPVKPEWEKGEIKNGPTDDDAKAALLTDLSLLTCVDGLTAEHDMHDQIRAKLFKARGYLMALKGNYPDALAALERALELDERIGVKKDVERLQSLAKP